MLQVAIHTLNPAQSTSRGRLNEFGFNPDSVATGLRVNGIDPYSSVHVNAAIFTVGITTQSPQ